MSTDNQTGVDTDTVTSTIQTLSIETVISDNEVIILSTIEVDGGQMFTMKVYNIENDTQIIAVSSLDIVVDVIREYQRKLKMLNSNVNK
jgi:hypothetical protein